MRKIQIGVIGVSNPTSEQYRIAEQVGRAIAGQDWVMINGGLGGVMEAASKGAAESGGTVIGILPTRSAKDANPYVSIPIVTNMGHARNVIIVQSADACIAIGKGKGTLSEIAIALKEGKPVVGLDSWDLPEMVQAGSAEEAVEVINKKV